MAGSGNVGVLGVFNADLVFEASRMPRLGETILGEAFSIGPGGKGSNQAVAAARAGATVEMMTRIGQDEFGELAMRTWAEAGIGTDDVIRDPERPTGTAFIFVSTETAENAIIVGPGAAQAIGRADVVEFRIEDCDVLIAQLELPVDPVCWALTEAKAESVTTVLNPAPAAELSEEVLGHVDYLTPNESEAEALSASPVGTLDQARAAADALLKRGVREAVVMTLGARGALYHGRDTSELVPAFAAEQVVDTTGAGDAFNGAFATALAQGRSPVAAVRFGNAAASVSVTRRGASAAMPSRAEIDALMAREPV